VGCALALVAFAPAPASAQASNGSPCAGGGPAASQYPPQNCGVAADQSTVTPGGSLTLTGDCPAGTDSVTFTLNPGGTSLGSATPNPQGHYTKRVTIPSSTQPGTYTIVASCTGVLGNGVTRTVTITVAAAAQGRSLPRTGSDSTLPIAGAGLGLVLVGGAAVVVARRRRPAA
jgi:LPXTG-motif cell wall-anchored protein